MTIALLFGVVVLLTLIMLAAIIWRGFEELWK